MKLAFIGLGVMGYPMAGHLQRAGHEVTVFNRTTEKARNWTAEYGGGFAETPALAAEGADVVFLCVGNDDDVRSVVLGEQGVIVGLAAGGIIVDHTTASATLAREMEAAALEKGLGFLDAPVSGGQAGAENAALTVMVGGAPDTFSQAGTVSVGTYHPHTLCWPALTSYSTGNNGTAVTRDVVTPTAFEFPFLVFGQRPEASGVKRLHHFGHGMKRCGRPSKKST